MPSVGCQVSRHLGEQTRPFSTVNNWTQVTSLSPIPAAGPLVTTSSHSHPSLFHNSGLPEMEVLLLLLRAQRCWAAFRLRQVLFCDLEGPVGSWPPCLAPPAPFPPHSGLQAPCPTATPRKHQGSSHGGSTTPPPAPGLKTTRIPYRLVLADPSPNMGLKGLESRCQQGCTPAGGRRQDPFSYPLPLQNAAWLPGSRPFPLQQSQP